MNQKANRPVSTVGKRIRQALNAKGMTPAELSRKTGISKSSISEYLKDKNTPKQKKIYLISEALDVPPAWLLGYDLPVKDELEPTNKDLSITQTVGNRIQHAMKITGVSEDELCLYTGISKKKLRSMIEGNEDRNFSLELMLKFCKVLHVNYSYFVSNLAPIEDISGNIRSLMEINHVSAEELAKALKIDIDTMNTYLNNESALTFNTIENIAHFFGYEFQDMLFKNYIEAKNDPYLSIRVRLIRYSRFMYEAFGKRIPTEEQAKEIVRYGEYILSRDGNKDAYND